MHRRFFLIGFQSDHASRVLEMSCTPRAVSDAETRERDWFAELIWSAFPEARRENWSERRLAEEAAVILSSEGRPVHWKTVRNWLRSETTPHFRYVLKVLALAGAEAIFAIVEPEDGL